MHAAKLLILAFVFFVTSIVSVVTGSTSLITVPVMIQCAIEPHVAVATNMFALIFLSLGGLAPLWKSAGLPRQRLRAATVLTITGSVIGALLLNRVSVRSLQLIIGIAMLAVAPFTLIKRGLGPSKPEYAPSRAHVTFGYIFTFALAVYGGFFSGGYVTLLTSIFTVFFHMTLVESIAATKLMNICSSVVATAIFAGRGIVDFRLGLLLGVAAFAGGLLGGTIALKLSPVWLRRVFLAAVLALALRMLVPFF